MKEYLNVGEISSLFGLNVQTMHYYERIGLFVPAARTESGHRKYAVDQIYQLSSIRYLRRMGYSIEEIREFLEERTPDETIRRLKEHSLRLQQQVEELQRLDDAIERKIRYIEHKRENLDTDRIEIRWFPERWYIPIGSENQLFGEEEFYLFPTIAFYEKEGKRFGGYVDLGIDGLKKPVAGRAASDLRSIPAGDYLVGYHVGAYEEIGPSFERMRAARPDLTFRDTVVNFNIIDQFVERDPDKYITEIQMPVETAGPEGENGGNAYPAGSGAADPEEVER